jgi:hypothetical protein
VALRVLALVLLFIVLNAVNALVDGAGDDATNPVAPNEDMPEPKGDAPSFPALSPALAGFGATAFGVCGGCGALLLASEAAPDAAAAPGVAGGVPNGRGESLAAAPPPSESERLDEDFDPPRGKDVDPKLKLLATGFAAGFVPTVVAGPGP